MVGLVRVDGGVSGEVEGPFPRGGGRQAIKKEDVRREAHDKISEAEIVVFGEVQKGTIMQRTMRLKEAAGV